MRARIVAACLAVGLALAMTGATVFSMSAHAIPLAPQSAPAASLVTPVQYGPGGLINPVRDCQTIRTCRYQKGGSWRGCVSTYTCRTCKLVPSRCDIGGRSGNCQTMQCSWGGSP